TYTDEATVEPPRTSVLAAFTFTVPATARARDVVRLNATARDKAGNSTSAAQIILPVTDEAPPTVTLRTESGRMNIAKGETVAILADVEDEIAVARVTLSGSGAFTVSDAKPISPPVGSATARFLVTVPLSAEAGSILTLTSRAFDVAGNESAPAVLALTIISVTDVTLPESALLLAGETQPVDVQIPGGAPAGGARIDLSVGNPGMADVAPSSLTFGAGETSKTALLTGVSGGTTALMAAAQGVPRATMTVQVRGGIVTGVVSNPEGRPVAGARVIVDSSTPDARSRVILAAETDGSGRYFVEGANFVNLAVKASDPQTRLIGYTSRRLNAPNGFATANVSLIPAGTVSGFVYLPDGVTKAGAAVKIELFDARNSSLAMATAFTGDDSHYEFPLVPAGSYDVLASDAHGNRARSSAVIAATGLELDVPITFIGRGTVRGTVYDAAGNAVANADLTFQSASIFGSAPTITTSAGQDGTFSFENVFVGQVAVQAFDRTTGQGGAQSGQIK